MSVTLTKDAITTIALGQPGSAGTPGAAPTPAYCVTTSRTEQSYTYEAIIVPPEFGEGVGQYQMLAIPGRAVTTYSTTCHPATAGTPPIPAVAGTPSMTATQYNLGWNAGAQSIETLATDGAASFSVGQGVVGAVVGLDSGALEFSRAGAEHALYFHANLVNVIELGADKTGSVPYLAADVFRIERSGSTVRYYHNAELLYTSTIPSYGVQYLEASMYSGGDVVMDAALVDTVTPGSGSSGYTGTGNSAGAMLPLSAAGGDADGYAYGYAAMGALDADATGQAEQGGRAVMSALQAIGSVGSYAASGTVSASAMTPITASGGGGVDDAPTYAIGMAPVGYIVASGYGLTAGNTTGEAAASAMRPLASLGGDYAYGGGAATIAPISATGATLTPLGGWAFLAMPAARLYAAGHDSTGENAAYLNFPAATFHAQCGAILRAIMPAAALSASATIQNMARASLIMPACEMSAAGTVSGMASAGLTMPVAEFVASGGATCSITLAGRLTIQASATVGGVASADLTMPVAEMTLSATVEAFAWADLVVPAMQMGGRARVLLAMPVFTMTATGTTAAVAVYEAYNINLTHAGGDQSPVDEVTRYTNFPFTQIVRYQGDYFGVAADGLYKLGGTTDDGEAIAYTVKTCASDFDAPELKSAASAYLAGRLGPLTVSLHAGEDGAESYEFDTLRGPLARNHREKFGRGVRNRYFALGLAGEDALELDSIELEINKTSRRI